MTIVQAPLHCRFNSLRGRRHRLLFAHLGPLCDASEIRWKVVDATTGHVVGRGTGATDRWRISGLTNSYYGRLDNCPRMTIRIHNS
ncbi:hypothetical protein SAMN05421833_105116 [Microbispora rosea]|uniref:Uncharacterized protein n=1 Tax=Microbispora rosea TaxID=58117 RepID=A0A1N6XE35_9ACTN|nr:hypothetical protein SAMN05421833_105116 [Microbispora rosea]